MSQLHAGKVNTFLAEYRAITKVDLISEHSRGGLHLKMSSFLNVHALKLIECTNDFNELVCGCVR